MTVVIKPKSPPVFQHRVTEKFKSLSPSLVKTLTALELSSLRTNTLVKYRLHLMNKTNSNNTMPYPLTINTKMHLSSATWKPTVSTQLHNPGCPGVGETRRATCVDGWGLSSCSALYQHLGLTQLSSASTAVSYTHLTLPTKA